MANFDADLLAAALPSYEIGKEVGRGGWGVVYEARHRQLDRTVAVKELPRAFAADPAVRRRFVSEARLLASLEHPHIVPIYDYVEHEGLCLLIMELLQGGTVWQRFTTEGISPQAALGIVLATCTALQYAHDAGVLHRDIKPENLLFTANGTLKVSDYGIAKVLGDTHTKATRTGEVLGTPAYMAPEQALGSELTPATDIYALGVLTYELLSGTLPFPDDGNAIGLLYRRVHEKPTPLTQSGPQVPAQLAEVVMHALETDPVDRPASAEAFGVDLAEACSAMWGPGWAYQSGISVRAPGAIADRLSGGHATRVPATPRSAPTPGVSGAARATIIEGAAVAPPVVADAPGTPSVMPAPPTEVAAAAAVASGEGQPAALVDVPTDTPTDEPPVPGGDGTDVPRESIPAVPAGAPGGASEPAESTKRSRVRPWILVVLALLLIAGVAAYLAFGNSGGSDQAAKGTATDTTVAATDATAGPIPAVTTVKVPGTVQWTDSQIALRPGDEVTITATGGVFSNPDSTVPAGPDGYADPAFHQFNLIPKGDHAGLIGRVGTNGTPFVVGASTQFTSDSSGHLFLGVNDAGVANNRGEFEARVTVKKP